MLKKILIGTGVVIAVVIAIGFVLPRMAHVERSIVIEAPQANVFTVLNGFRQFNAWSPWADIDPNAKTLLEGPAAGVGSKMSWSGNAEVGEGSQEILESTPHSLIKVKLGFGDFPGDFVATYTLVPEGAGTKVTWGFDADYGSSLMGRYFGLLSDAMLGPDYEKGLSRLKAYVEKLPKGDLSTLSFEQVEVPPSIVVITSIRSTDTPSAIGVSLGVAYGRLQGYMSTAGLKQAAPPIAIYRGTDGGTVAIDAAIPVDRADAAPVGALRIEKLAGGPAMRAEYKGPYTGLPAARAQLQAYLVATGEQSTGAVWEQYVSDPANVGDADLVTHIFSPI